MDDEARLTSRRRDKYSYANPRPRRLTTCRARAGIQYFDRAVEQELREGKHENHHPCWNGGLPESAPSDHQQRNKNSIPCQFTTCPEDINASTSEMLPRVISLRLDKIRGLLCADHDDFLEQAIMIYHTAHVGLSALPGSLRRSTDAPVARYGNTLKRRVRQDKCQREDPKPLRKTSAQKHAAFTFRMTP